jgi:hypothetical protein
VIDNVSPAQASDRAYVADASGIAEIDPATGAVAVVAQGGAWCSVDARAHVLWFTSDDGLSAVDLTTRKASLVVQGALGQVQPIIDWGMTGEYLRVTPAGIRRTTSVPDPHTLDGSSDYGGLRASPAGLSYRGFVFNARRVIYAPKEQGTTCGWTSGGWRVPGPGDGIGALGAGATLRADAHALP